MPDYKFTKDWFEMNSEHWSSIVGSIKSLHGDSAICVDAGTYEGRSAIYMLDNLVGDNGRLYIIDTFPDPEVAARFRHNIAQHPRADQVEVITSDVIVALNDLFVRLGGSVHFLYLDAAKSALGNSTSLALGERMLAVNGIMIVDDYMWLRVNDPRARPKLGINAYSSQTLLCQELSVPRTQAAFVKIYPNSHIEGFY